MRGGAEKPHRTNFSCMYFSYECSVKSEFGKVRSFFNSPANLLKITPLSFLMGVEPMRELEDGLRIRLKFVGFTLMESLIRDVGPYGFTDVALKKPPFIRYWEHRHRFVPKGASTVIEDHLTVEAQLPESLIRSLIGFMFKYRCWRIKRFLE